MKMNTFKKDIRYAIGTINPPQRYGNYYKHNSLVAAEKEEAINYEEMLKKEEIQQNGRRLCKKN